MNKRTVHSAPARHSLGEGGFFSLRVLIGLLIALTGAILALLGFGTLTVPTASFAQTQTSYSPTNSIDPLIPAAFDCSKIHELGIDKRENMRARAIMILCGRSEGGIPFHGSGASKLVQ